MAITYNDSTVHYNDTQDDYNGSILTKDIPRINNVLPARVSIKQVKPSEKLPSFKVQL